MQQSGLQLEGKMGNLSFSNLKCIVQGGLDFCQMNEAKRNESLKNSKMKLSCKRKNWEVGRKAVLLMSS